MLLRNNWNALLWIMAPMLRQTIQLTLQARRQTALLNLARNRPPEETPRKICFQTLKIIRTLR